MKLPKLNSGQKEWVDFTLKSLTLREKAAQVLLPQDRYTNNEWRLLLEKVPVGGVFVGSRSDEKLRQQIRIIQENSRVPVLIASDLEYGAGCMISECIEFPYMMACGAANDVKLAERMGEATAIEGRALGIHWTFSPIVDLSINLHSPITNIQALGEDPGHVIPLARAIIRGIQKRGIMAATAKHFPSGADDRDPHLCTSANFLSREKWNATFKKVWHNVIEEGVMSIMVGHIALPCVDRGAKEVFNAPPATLSEKLQIKLLRKELGFDGLIVSDAFSMGGFKSYLPEEDLVVQNIARGSDMGLFADPKLDHKRLLRALKQGILSEKRLNDAVRRILELKARLGLHKRLDGPKITSVERKKFSRASEEMAECAVAIVHDPHNMLPVSISKNAKVLTISFKYEYRPEELIHIDNELRRRGFKVKHLTNPGHKKVAKAARTADAVFVNLAVVPHGRGGTIRMTGEVCGWIMMTLWRNYPKVIFTSFGSPYIWYEMPSVPNMVLTYSATPASQRAAVKVWLGEIKPGNNIPVSMPPFFKKNV